jgi:protein PhnA
MDVSNVKDSNGNPLNDGDAVLLIKSLKVKGGNTTLKQGTLVKRSALLIMMKKWIVRLTA